MTFPKMVYLPSRDGCLAYAMKNWYQRESQFHTHLRLVRPRPCVGHSHHSPGVELKCRPHLVWKRASPDAVAAFAGASRVAGLHHEAFDVAVEEVVIVVS